MATSKKKFYPPYTVIKCDWADSWSSDDDDGDMKPIPLTVLGYVVSHNEHGIKLAMERAYSSRSNAFRRVHFIPAFNIVKLSVLEKA